MHAKVNHHILSRWYQHITIGNPPFPSPLPPFTDIYVERTAYYVMMNLHYHRFIRSNIRGQMKVMVTVPFLRIAIHISAIIESGHDPLSIGQVLFSYQEINISHRP